MGGRAAPTRGPKISLRSKRPSTWPEISPAASEPAHYRDRDRGLPAREPALAEVPLFLAALLLVRGLPAMLHVRFAGAQRARAAGLLQATSLTFVIAAAQIGLASGKITTTTSASLLAAGLLPAALFPATALKLLSHRKRAPEPVQLEKQIDQAPDPGCVSSQNSARGR